MPSSCCVYGCNSTVYRGCGIAFHRIPKFPEMREKWKKVLLGQDNKHSKVCELHFKPEDYIAEFLPHRRLKPTAIPSTFPKLSKEKRQKILKKKNIIEDTVPFDESAIINVDKHTNIPNAYQNQLVEYILTNLPASNNNSATQNTSIETSDSVGSPDSDYPKVIIVDDMNSENLKKLFLSRFTSVLNGNSIVEEVKFCDVGTIQNKKQVRKESNVISKSGAIQKKPKVKVSLKTRRKTLAPSLATKTSSMKTKLGLDSTVEQEDGEIIDYVIKREISDPLDPLSLNFSEIPQDDDDNTNNWRNLSFSSVTIVDIPPIRTIPPQTSSSGSSDQPKVNTSINNAVDTVEDSIDFDKLFEESPQNIVDKLLDDDGWLLEYESENAAREGLPQPPPGDSQNLKQEKESFISHKLPTITKGDSLSVVKLKTTLSKYVKIIGILRRKVNMLKKNVKRGVARRIELTEKLTFLRKFHNPAIHKFLSLKNSE